VVYNGGLLLEATWQGYGFKLGTLAKLRGKILVFKQQRGSKSSTASGTEDEES